MKDLTAINTLTRGYACDLATKQCVCGEKTMDATPCLNSGACAQNNAICAVKVNLFTGAVSSELCSNSNGVSYCAMDSLSAATGKCTTFFNDVVDASPACSVSTLTYPPSEISFRESLCVGFADNIETSAFSIIMSRTFVFPCTDIASAGSISRTVRVGCFKLHSDVSAQESRMSVVTYNTLRMHSGFSYTRRLLEYSEQGNSTSARAMHTGQNSTQQQGALLLSFAQQVSARVAQVPGRCGHILTTCLSTARSTPTKATNPSPSESDSLQRLYRSIYYDRDCFHCMQTWWFFNYTLQDTRSPGGAQEASGRPAYEDVDYMDVRSVLVHLVRAPYSMPGILGRTPRACYLLFKDWLADDMVLDTLIEWLRVPVKFMDVLLYKILHELAVSEHGAHSPLQGHPGPFSASPQQSLHAADKHGGAILSESLRYLSGVALGGPHMHTGPSWTRREDPSTDSVRDSSAAVSTLSRGRRLLQQPVSPVDTAKLAAIKASLEGEKGALLDDLTLLRTQTYGTVFESSDMSCVISAGILQNEIVMSFANVLQKDGWTLKPLCSKQQIVDFSKTPAQCPLVSAPLVRVYENTVVLAEYYGYMMQSGCLSNMSISCLSPPLFAAKGVMEVAPGLPPFNQSQRSIYNDTHDLSKEQDVISFYILSVFYTASDIMSFDRSELLSMVAGFITMDALYDDTLYTDMVRRNQFTVGRLVRDLFNCNLRDTITCQKKNLPLLAVFTVMFLITLALTILLPIPSVIVFYMWTLGLFYGTIYLAYNFSPLCTPRIPTCLGSGLYDLSNQLLPENIYVPKTLYNYEQCDANLTIRTDAGPIPRNFTCGKTCLQAPYKLDNVLSLSIAVETLFRNGDALTVRYLLTEYGFIATYSSQQYYFDVVTRMARDVQQNQDDYVTGLYVCIFFNAYKAIGLILIILFVIPAALYLLVSTMSYMLVLIVKYTLITYNTDIYDNLH